MDWGAIGIFGACVTLGVALVTIGFRIGNMESKFVKNASFDNFLKGLKEDFSSCRTKCETANKEQDKLFEHKLEKRDMIVSKSNAEIHSRLDQVIAAIGELSITVAGKLGK